MSTTDVEEHVVKRYEIRRRIGKGAYGIVWKSVDRRNGEIVALKKIFDAFSNATDAQRTYREVMFLQAFSSHENVIQLLNVVRATNNIDLYLVFEFMDTDLHAVIKNGLLSSVHHQYIMYQLLKVMKYIHSGHCIHRDMKPSNILINTQCHIKLADFGLARSLSLPPPSSTINPSESLPAMTDYVATRWYRSPEILLGGQVYTTGVDMWSVGCILAEMIAGRPLFPGTSTMNQIERIMTLLPQPSKQEIEAVGAQYAMAILTQIPRRRVKRLENLLPAASEEALDLLTKLLRFSTERRLTAHSALHHLYVKKFHDVKKERVLDYDVILHFNDNTQLSVDQYRDRLYLHIDGPGNGGESRKEEKEKEERKEEEVDAAPTPLEVTPTSERAQSAEFTPRHITAPKVSRSTPVVCKPRLLASHAHQSHPSTRAGPDLTICSSRIIPSPRPGSGRSKVTRGAPSKVAMGTYTQTHGTISKSNLQRLLGSVHQQSPSS